MKKEDVKKQEEAKKSETQVLLQQFSKELSALQERFEVVIYAVNQVQENGEVLPTIKVLKKEDLKN
jgi:hypothetical protein